MAYRRRSRAPIKSTKAYKRGMIQTAGIVTAVLVLFPAGYKMIFDFVDPFISRFRPGGGA